jgi:hypothetical protein
MDFVFAIVIFIMCMFLFYTFYPNLSSRNADDLDDAYLDGRLISTALLGSGYPANWTNVTVERIGITDDHAVNLTKWQLFADMTVADYPDVKSLFSLRSDFVVFFANDTGVQNVSGIHHVGYAGVNGTGAAIDLSGIEYEQLVSFERIVLVNGTVLTMVVYTWY